MRILLLIAVLMLPALQSAADPIRFARAESMLSLPILLAETNGYFADEGVDVTFVTTLVGKRSIEKLLSGEADLAVGGTPPVVRQLLDKKPLCIVSNLTESDNTQKIISSRQSGIRLPEDLLGKRIGLPFGTGADYGFREFMVFNALTKDDLELVNIRPAQLVKGLSKNNIDTLVLWEPLANQVKSVLGEDYQLVAGSENMLLEYPIVTRPETARKRHAELVKILRALQRANRFAIEKRAETIQITAQRLQLEQAQAEEFLDDHLYRLAISPRLLHALERIAEMMLADDNSRKKIPDFSHSFCQQALLEVAPDNDLLKYTGGGQ